VLGYNGINSWISIYLVDNITNRAEQTLSVEAIPDENFTSFANPQRSQPSTQRKPAYKARLKKHTGRTSY
jgi:hypothetical protein